MDYHKDENRFSECTKSCFFLEIKLFLQYFETHFLTQKRTISENFRKHET